MRKIILFGLVGLAFTLTGRSQTAGNSYAVSSLHKGAIRPFQQGIYTTSGRYDRLTGLPKTLYHVNAGPFAGTPETIARKYLETESARFGMIPDLSDLVVTAVQTTPAGNHVRFGQFAGGLPVAGADVVVSINPSGFVTFVSSNHAPGINLPS